MVEINNYLSAVKIINPAVPQGSIPGHLLFLLFINDLPTVLGHSRCILYVDDNTISAADKSHNSIEEKLNTNLRHVQSWCKENLSHINPSKTTFMVFNLPQLRISFSLVASLENHSLPLTVPRFLV